MSVNGRNYKTVYEFYKKDTKYEINFLCSSYCRCSPSQTPLGRLAQVHLLTVRLGLQSRN